MPKVSILTPSHDARHLPDLARSIARQTFTDWEWVIYANGALTAREAAGTVRSCFSDVDFAKVVTVPGRTDLTAIGALKRETFGLGKGIYLVEADHDDILLPDCLREVISAFEGTEADFVYSNMAKFESGSWKCAEWSATVPVRPFEYEGRTLYEGRVTPLSRAVHMLFHAIGAGANHVRAWRRDFYDWIGGHDPRLTVMDDMELVARSYARGGRFHPIDKCLYLWRTMGGDAQTSYRIQVSNALVRAGEFMGFYRELFFPALFRWCGERGLSIIETLEDLRAAEPDSAGAILPGSRMALPLPELLLLSHRALADGGFLATPEPMDGWRLSEVRKFTRPSNRPRERFQELFLLTPPEDRLGVHLAAKKTDEPLPGEDLWHPRVNALDAGKFGAMFAEQGCSLRFDPERGKLVASGPEKGLSLLLSTLRAVSAIYETTVEIENVPEPGLVQHWSSP